MWGYGCCFPGHWEFAAPFDEDERQTNNRAELKGAIAGELKVMRRTVIFWGFQICFRWGHRESLHLAPQWVVWPQRPNSQLHALGGPLAGGGCLGTPHSVGVVAIPPRHTRQ